MKISDLTTPCLLIEQSTMRANIARLTEHIQDINCRLRPHVKTHKSVDITKEIETLSPMSGITVSTIAEARHFFDAGYSDILYAVGIVNNKYSHIRELMDNGCDIKLIVDSVEAALQLSKDGEFERCCYKVLIEIDVDGHRAGIKPLDPDLLSIAKTLHTSEGCKLMGVMTHAGGSYTCDTPETQLAMARQERDLALLAANRLKESNLPCPIVSIGSTPTAFAIDDLKGITEVRAGVYVLFDLVMAGLQVCDTQDIAISVLSSITGFQKDKNLAICDAGWMAMSRDRGTSVQKIDQGYGLVCDVHCSPISNLIMTSANQEHGIVSTRSAKQRFPFEDHAISDLLRILPNHACSTAAQFPYYYLVDGQDVVRQLFIAKGW
jgi:D-serine deaminase-like pyridoxal phosphate-dependent protein